MTHCPVCGLNEIKRVVGTTYGRCSSCKSRVHMTTFFVPLPETKEQLIARLLREAKAARESTMEVSPEPKVNE